MITDKKIFIILAFKFCAICFVLCALFSGCVQMRDYTAASHGAFCVVGGQKFGEGEAGKDYYIIYDDLYIEKGDTKNEVIAKLGTPDVIESGSSYEIWNYKDKELRLFFETDRLKYWNDLEGVSAD